MRQPKFIREIKAKLASLRHSGGDSLRRLGIVAVGLLVGAMGLSILAEAASAKPLTAYQVQLRSQVQAPNGAPLSGRDPAAQPQSSLAAAASQPSGDGLRVDTPAVNVKGAETQAHAHIHPSDILPDPKTSGMLFSGCLTGFSKPGEKCVTNTAPGQESASCAYDSSLPCTLRSVSAIAEPKKN